MCKKISDLKDLARLWTRGLPNIEGDQVAQQASPLQIASQWEHCMHTITLTLHNSMTNNFHT